MRFFGTMHGAAILAHVEQVPVSSMPSDTLSMDDLPPPAPRCVAQLFGLTVEELSGPPDVSGSRHPPLSEYPLTADPVALRPMVSVISRPKGSCRHHEKLIVVPDGTPEYS